MKKFQSFTVMTFFILITFIISGCLPPNYTKEKAKEIAKNHKNETLSWFTSNMQDAKPDNDVEAYETGVDLLGAIKGNYKRNGKSYKYVYEYTNKKMYIGEGYDETCKIVQNEILKDFGYTKEEAEISFHGYQFACKNENDDTKPRYNNEIEKAKELYSYQEKLMPADKTPEQFAKAILDINSKEKFDFYMHLYRDDFPAQQLEKQKQYKNLGSIWCSAKIDLTKQKQGFYEKVYLKDRIENRYYHIEKISDNLYGGYINYKGIPAEGDRLKISYKDGKHLTLEIPKSAKPILFSKNSLTLVHYFKNTKGDTIENIAEEMYRSTKAGVKGFHQYDTDLFVKDDFSYGYTSIKVPLVGGVYTYKILGIFDFDYWKLKFFE